MGFRTFLAHVIMALGCTPILAAEAPSLSVYGSLPGLEMASLSPSGARVAIIGTVNEQRRLVIIDSESEPVSSVQLGDVKVRSLHWAGDETLLVCQSSTRELSRLEFTTDKAELYSMLVLPLNGGEPWGVFEGERFITGGVRGFYGIREKKGRYFGYFGGIALDGSGAAVKHLVSTHPVLYEVDLRSRKVRRIASRTEGDAHREWIVGSDGRVSATLDFSDRNGNWRITNSDGKQIASGTDPDGDVSLVGLGAESDALVYSVAGNEGQHYWLEVPASGGESRALVDSVSVRQRVFDERSGRLLGYMEGGDLPAYKLFDGRRQKVIDATLKAFPGKGVHLRDWNGQFTKLIVTTEGQGDPGTWWLVDISTGKADDLGISYTLRSQDIGPVRMVHYRAGDGLDIAAVLTLPPGKPEENLPVVVMPHGGPGARDYPEFDWWAQAFASRGYAVLQPNYRGSTGYGSSFRLAGDGEWGRKMQTDISDGLAFLAQQGIVDPSRACIVGASYGGYAALAGVTLQKGIYRCAVSVAGISDVAGMVQTLVQEAGRDPILARALRREIGSGRDLRVISPIRYAESADAPVLLIHGKDDTVVNYQQSADMAEALQAAAKPVEFLTLAGEDHWLSRSETRMQMLEATVTFVQKHNPSGSAN